MKVSEGTAKWVCGQHEATHASILDANFLFEQGDLVSCRVEVACQANARHSRVSGPASGVDDRCVGQGDGMDGLLDMVGPRFGQRDTLGGKWVYHR